MRLEVTHTPRETLIWAPTAADAEHLREFLLSTNKTILPAEIWELEFFGMIPDGERDEFDPARIINIEIGADEYDSLVALRDAGHELVWHRWQGPVDYDVI